MYSVVNLKKSVLFNQRQDPRSFQLLVEEEASALRPSRVELHLHFPVGFEVVRREALHIALVEVRDVEYLCWHRDCNSLFIVNRSVCFIFKMRQGYLNSGCSTVYKNSSLSDETQA